MNLSTPNKSIDNLGNDDVLFSDEIEEPVSENKPAWKVMIVDDDHDIHTVTKIIFDDFAFKGRKVQFIDAYSGDEACQLLIQHPDTAAIFLDVVMETENAGLIAVKRIREEIGNNLVRIILRTGQPGQAPEHCVIVDYDINDYKSKTELTAQKLSTSLIAALRSYSDLKSIDTNRRCLLKILDASSHLDFKLLRVYVSGMLMQLANLLEVAEDDFILIQQREANGPFLILASSGNREPFVGEPVLNLLSPQSCKTIQQVFSNQVNLTEPDYSVYVVSGKSENNVVAYLDGPRILGQVDLALVGFFCEKILLAYENHNLIEEYQTDLEIGITLLAQMSNPSYTDAVARAKYIGMLSRDIAENLTRQNEAEQLSRDVRKQILRAAMLCDLGNMYLPESLWANTGLLSEAERELIKTHPVRGSEHLIEHIPPSCEQGVFVLAQKIIFAHHERYDGSGYPLGLSGKNIPLEARIVAVADTFIALTSTRPYRSAVDHEEAVSIIVEGAGSLFDPAVVRAFLEVADNYRQGLLRLALNLDHD